MNKLFKIHWLAALCGLTMLSLTACNDDDNPENKSPEVNPDINVNVETYAGGELGTTFNNSASAYEDPTPATENAGMTDKFKYGEYFFERSYTQNSKPFNGFGTALYPQFMYELPPRIRSWQTGRPLSC